MPALKMARRASRRSPPATTRPLRASSSLSTPRSQPRLLWGIEAQLLNIAQEAEESPHLLASNRRREVRDLDDGRGAQGEAERHPDPSAVHHGGSCTTAALAARPHAAGEAGPRRRAARGVSAERPRAPPL